MSESHNSNSHPLFKILDTTLILALLTALVYTAGWFYAFYYFAELNIGLLTLQIPKDYFFVYGFSALKEHVFLITFVYGLAVMFYLFPHFAQRLRFFKNRQNMLSLAVTIFTPVLILSLFAGAYRLGKSTAKASYDEQRLKDYPAYPRVEIKLKKAKQPEAMQPLNTDKTAEALQKGCYRLMLHNQDKLFLFYPIKGMPTADLAVLVIQKDDVERLIILPNYDSCGG